MDMHQIINKANNIQIIMIIVIVQWLVMEVMN